MVKIRTTTQGSASGVPCPEWAESDTPPPSAQEYRAGTGQWIRCPRVVPTSPENVSGKNAGNKPSIRAGGVINNFNIACRDPKLATVS